MKDYMVVWVTEDGQGASFFDRYSDAYSCRMDIDCGLGGYAEIYERQPDPEMPRLSSYVMIEA